MANQMANQMSHARLDRPKPRGWTVGLLEHMVYRSGRRPRPGCGVAGCPASGCRRLSSWSDPVNRLHQPSSTLTRCASTGRGGEGVRSIGSAADGCRLTMVCEHAYDREAAGLGGHEERCPIDAGRVVQVDLYQHNDAQIGIAAKATV